MKRHSMGDGNGPSSHPSRSYQGHGVLVVLVVVSVDRVLTANEFAEHLSKTIEIGVTTIPPLLNKSNNNSNNMVEAKEEVCKKDILQISIP